MTASSPFDNPDTGGLVANAARGDNAQGPDGPLSISELSALLKRTVEDRFGFIRVRGELSGVKRAASGHVYLSLKDEGARLDGVMWRGNAQRLGFQPEDGVEVVATGKLTTYPGRSSYQIVIDRMEVAGEGALLALLAKTKARLEAEGLFDSRRKRPLPFLPGVIGVVTSPTGAVIRDILHRLADRFPSRVVVWPVLVQGQGAAEQVAAAVRGFSALPPDGAVPRPDLVIVARGGGSIEDLWAFNEEPVVRAIAASTIPVISAVGHETDTTLADFAADRRAPTPTAAAEMAVPVREDLAAQLAELAWRKRRCALRPVQLGRERLEARVQRLPRPEALVGTRAQKLDDLADRLRRGLAGCIVSARAGLQNSAGRLSAPLLAAQMRHARQRLDTVRLRPADLVRRIDHARQRLDTLDRLRLQLDPRAPLKRGYALVTGPDGHVVTGRDAAARLAAMTLEFHDGALSVCPVTPGAAPAPAPATPGTARPSRSAAKPDPSRQGDLF